MLHKIEIPCPDCKKMTLEQREEVDEFGHPRQFLFGTVCLTNQTQNLVAS